MKIHEYQAKEILGRYGVPVPEGRVADDADEACHIAGTMAYPVVVKAQVHIGGRGKAGGVRLARTPEELRSAASAILGMDIRGHTVQRILIEPAIDIQREMYLSLLVDRARRLPCLMVSAAGGIDIEEVAAATPERILRIHIKPTLGVRKYHVVRCSAFLGLPPSTAKVFGGIVDGLFRAFLAEDCSLVEINPLAIADDGAIIACDAKITFDDNAAFRHAEHEALRDDGQEEPLEVKARQAGVSYVRLDGDIGCIVNGAGLAMATMDIVEHLGGRPANFLDIGGAARPEQVTEALRIVTADPGVKTVLFNIFGGIVRCDRVAEGILEAIKRLDLRIPLVLRLVGTNEREARDMLEGTPLLWCSTMSEAAKRAVEISRNSAPMPPALCEQSPRAVLTEPV